MNTFGLGLPWVPVGHGYILDEFQLNREICSKISMGHVGPMGRSIFSWSQSDCVVN
jgi:hypothetical protein